MAGTLVQTPSNGAADYTDFLAQMERVKKGFFNIDFTTLSDGSTAPEIKAGSWIEVDGNIYKFTSAEAITGWAGIATSTPCYVKVTPSGTSITASFTTDAPTYTDLKNGWYSGNDRYILWLYKDSIDEYTLMRTENEIKKNLKVISDITLPNNSIDLAFLAQGVLDTYLKAQGVGVVPIYEKLALRDTGIHIGNGGTRSTDGNQVITGVGFQPSVIIFFAGDTTESFINFSVGFDNGTVHMALNIFSDAASQRINTAQSIDIDNGGGNRIKGYVSAIGADGFTITWNVLGTRSVNFIYLCLP